MAFLATLRVSTIPSPKEAIHGSYYRLGPLPPSRPTATATGSRAPSALCPPLGPRLGPASPACREGLLPRPPVHPLGHPLGLPLPGPGPRPLLPCRRRTLLGLAGRTETPPL